MTTQQVAILALLAVVSVACDRTQPPTREDLEHPDYQALADELIMDRPTVVTVDLLRGRLDSATLERIAVPITQLDDALSRLTVLHQIHDTATTEQLRSRVNLLAMPFHLLADRSTRFVLVELPPEHRVWFHEFIEQRAQAAGLPHDVWRVEPAAMNELRGVRHTPALHDTSSTPRR